jgi:peptidyl-prolyl cis-trans isomerase SurA
MLINQRSKADKLWGDLMLKIRIGVGGIWLASAAAVSCFVAAPPPAVAQELMLSVNGAPITSYDVEERMKLLRLLKKPASREAAIDDLIADKVKLSEIAKFTIHLDDSDIMAQGAQDAQEAKIPPAAFAQELKSAGIDDSNWREHFRAQAEWNLYVKAMNKTVDVSDQQVDAAMAKTGQSPSLTEYLVRQVVIVVPDPNAVDQKMPEANDLRARFDGCASGVAMAQQEPDVVVQSLITRTSASLSDQVKAELDQTPVGKLTPPERSAEGIEMIAVCSRNSIHDDSADDPIRTQLLKDKLEKASAALYAPLRAHAVIVRFHS